MNALQIALAVFAAYVAGALTVVLAQAFCTGSHGCCTCVCKEKR